MLTVMPSICHNYLNGHMSAVWSWNITAQIAPPSNSQSIMKLLITLLLAGVALAAAAPAPAPDAEAPVGGHGTSHERAPR